MSGVLDLVAANNARFVAGLAKKDAAKKSVGMDEREIDGEYVPGKVDHAATLKTISEEVTAEYITARDAHAERVTAADKLRLIADTVEGQQPFGTEVANFRRRLLAILSIGHDA